MGAGGSDSFPLDVPRLLHASAVRGGPPVGRLLLVGVGLAVALPLLWPGVVGQTLSALALLGTLVAIIMLSAGTYRGFVVEQQRVQQVEDLVQLRRWQEAAMLLEALMSRPMRNPVARWRAMVMLSAVLMRYHRFEDAIAVHDLLLSEQGLDSRSEYGIRVARAMAMLRLDRLYDADRAISELRRMTVRSDDRRRPEEIGGWMPAAADSAGLALVEMYRDVKTGHPQEALDLFRDALPTLRRQLGVQSGQAFALAARAAELLGREDDARRWWQDATTLVPASELLRRYTEIGSLARFPVAEMPAALRAVGAA
jgi:tetratricopeptide (TPR) repeat protein